ncbi:hypothetical protein Droror1_Dr00008782, partial [Drosera rotundifolia]
PKAQPSPQSRPPPSRYVPSTGAPDPANDELGTSSNPRQHETPFRPPPTTLFGHNSGRQSSMVTFP